MIGRTICLKVRQMWMCWNDSYGVVRLFTGKFHQEQSCKCWIRLWNKTADSFAISSFNNAEDSYIVYSIEGTDSIWKHGNEGAYLQKVL